MNDVPELASVNRWLLLGTAIVAEVIGTSFMKSSEGFTRLGPSLAVVLGYGLAFYLLSLTLKEMPVGVAYAVWSGVGIALITLVAWAVHGQRLNWPSLLGLGLIMAGVAVLQLYAD